MRSFAAGVLLFLLMGQSSGAAMAATGTSGNVAGFDFAKILAPHGAVEGSQLVAELTGSGDRYAAMHAPPPRIVRATNHLEAAELVRSVRPLRPRVRAGVRDRVIMPPISELDAAHRRHDPLAMRRSTVPSEAVPA